MELKRIPPLDRGFQPLEVLLRDYERRAKAGSGCRRLVVNLERNQGYCDWFEMALLPEGVEEELTLGLSERMVKTFLWSRGGYKVTIAGAQDVYRHIADTYRAGGAREFDADFMANVYERPFEVLLSDDPDAIAVTRGNPSDVGRHLDGCRIGFDAGGSDRKVSAVIDGEAVYSEEVVWHPKLSADPQYQYDGILESFRPAAAHMPRVDAIGISSAGVYVNNRIMNASLFLKVPKDEFDRRVKTMYLDTAREIGPDIPVQVENDGDVTALAGAMELNAGNVLGIAMGTSEAGGYVDRDMRILGYLNELAFAPVDFDPDAMRDEWSGDIGCGVKYFSQDAVIKLAPAAGIALDESLSPAEKLKVVQGLMLQGHEGARAIYESIGVYFGYSLAYYARFYQIDHVLIMGRVTSGEGGVILLNAAREVLDREFPELKMELHIPDENSRRVGQSVAAASLPRI